MQLFRLTAGVAGLALLVSVPAAAAAQDTGASQVPDSIQALFSEFQQLQGRLQQAQMQAVEGDTALQTEQQQLQATIPEAMVEDDPALEAKMDSLPGLQQAAMAAQQSGDTTELETLMATGQRIQATLQEAQQEVVEQEEVAQEIEAFQEQLMTAMEAIDPEIRSVVDRLEEISTRIQAFQEGGGG